MKKLDTNTKDLIVNNIIGDMSWHGETYADEKSLENMQAGNEIVLELIDKMYENATLPPNAAATASGSLLKAKSREMLRYIKTICDEVER